MTDEEDRERASLHEDRMSKRRSEGMEGGTEGVDDRLDKKWNDAVKGSGSGRERRTVIHM